MASAYNLIIPFWKGFSMNAGYVRLSRDDDKRNYVSIENQKLIIRQYAETHGAVINRWYEDDGFSGYIFDRPGFQQLMTDLDNGIDTVYVKDFSRLGRHNAKVLLLLDEFQERSKHLIVIDDNYDSMDSSDDMIGIKTWFNERYVKDTSQKIKRAISARQKEGTLLTRPPFGYQRSPDDKKILEIIPKEAEIIREIYRLYLSGLGYRRIALFLTDHSMPTPSQALHEREIKLGKLSRRSVAYSWSDGMEKEILDNDFYTGVLRLKKRSRSTVHGKDKRVPKGEQYFFPDHHPAIIDPANFTRVQREKANRSRTAYRGASPSRPFVNLLFCQNCGHRLTPIHRKTSSGERNYYICSTYNSKGKRYCPKAHLVEEEDLMADVLACLRRFRDTLTKEPLELTSPENDVVPSIERIRQALSDQKKQLQLLLNQKIRDLSLASENEVLIQEAYAILQKERSEKILALEKELLETEASLSTKPLPFKDPLTLLDQLIENRSLTRKDLALLIDRIEVSETGDANFYLHGALAARRHAGDGV